MDLLKFAIIWLSLVLLPGPDMIFVITESMKNGTRNGVKIALGLCSGLAFYSIVVLTGFGLVISKIPALTLAIKYLGAGYLVYIGVKGWLSIVRDRGDVNEVDDAKRNEGVEYKNRVGYNPYLRGVIMNITNPKVLIFFLSFLPQFIDIDNNTPFDISLIFVILVGIALSTFSLTALFASKISQYFKQRGVVSIKSKKLLAFIEMMIYLVIAGCVVLT